MAEIKAHEFDQFLKRRSRDYRLFLVYGPDRGLVSERAADLAKLAGVDLADAFSSCRLDASDLAGDPGRLYDEVFSTGLFGGDKLIWVKGAGADKGLADASSDISDKIPAGVTVILEAGDLKKGANLRKAVEGSAGGVAIPCYADDTKSLNALIERELAESGLGITSDARQLLLECLGGDRLASRNEIRKLCLFAQGKTTVEAQDVLDIVGDASAISADDAVDCVLSGDSDGFQRALQKVIASKTPAFLVLQGCLRMLQLLELMRAEMDERRSGSAEVMNIHARHLHFRRKPIVENALRQWPAGSIAMELSRVQNAILQTRRRSSLEDTIASQTLLATTLVAKRQRDRRS